MVKLRARSVEQKSSKSSVYIQNKQRCQLFILEKKLVFPYKRQTHGNIAAK
jgi:hypothetical protein